MTIWRSTGPHSFRTQRQEPPHPSTSYVICKPAGALHPQDNDVWRTFRRKNNELRAYTGELTARNEDMSMAHAEALCQIAQLEIDNKGLRVDIKTYMEFSIPGKSDQE